MMRYLILLFSLLGIGLQLRMLPFFDPLYSFSFAQLWSEAPLPNRMLVVIGIAIPFAYYLFCAATCFIKYRSFPLTIGAMVLFAAAVPIFFQINEGLPTVAKNAALTGMFWLFYYASRPRRPTA